MKKTYIEKLREKPEHHRKRIAFGTSAAITAFIALFWVTSFSYFNGTATNDVQVARANNENSPLNVIKRGAANVFGSITGSKVEVKEEATTTPSLEYVPDPTFQEPVATSTVIN